MITLQEMAYLSTLYTQPHRHYHNMNHINECLGELEAMCAVDQIACQYQDIIGRAIWYHDAVYNPYSKVNEYVSADLIPTPEDEHIRMIIRTTAHHLETQEFKGFSNSTYAKCAQIVLDIDLAGFGKPFDICWKNSENIRKEFSFVGELDFNKGRLTFLETIQKRESLYYTGYFKEKYHVQSQKNIATEIAKTKEIIDLLTT